MNKLKEKSDDHTRIFECAPLTQKEAWTCCFAICPPGCTHPLPASHLSHDQLHPMQKKAIGSFLSKCGFNRNHPRAAVLRPASHGGLSCRHLCHEQSVQQILMTMKHWRADTSVGKLMKTVSRSGQFLAGGHNNKASTC